MNPELKSSDGASAPKPQPFQVGTWEVDPRLNRIRGPSGETRVEPKVMKVLLRLARDPGDPVGKDELLRDIWGVATEDVLSRAISHLRRAFSDDAKNPQIIETVYKVGYRLIADVARVRAQTMRRLTAIMFTDMVGYTALMQEDERSATTLRDRHRTVLREGIEAHQGEIVQFYGDGTLSVFPSAVQAVDAAVDIQRRFRQDHTIPVRIGRHIGDIGHPDVQAKIDETLKRILASGRTAGTYTSTADVARFVALGVSLLMVTVAPWLAAAAAEYKRRSGQKSLGDKIAACYRPCMVGVAQRVIPVPGITFFSHKICLFSNLSTESALPRCRERRHRRLLRSIGYRFRPRSACRSG